MLSILEPKQIGGAYPSMNIPILYDSGYEKDSVWGGMLQSAIAKTLLQKKYTSTIIDPHTYQQFDYDSLFEDVPRLLLVVANDRVWLEEAFRFFSAHNIQIVWLTPIHSPIHASGDR